MLMLTRRSHRLRRPLVLVGDPVGDRPVRHAALASPRLALGAATFPATCDANLRTKPSTSATRKAALAEGGQM